MREFSNNLIVKNLDGSLGLDSGLGRKGRIRVRGPRSIRCSEIDEFALVQRIRRIDDNAVRRTNPLEHFQCIPKIPPNRDFFKIDSILGPNDGGHCSIRAKQKRVNRQGKALAGDLDAKMDFRVRPRYFSGNSSYWMPKSRGQLHKLCGEWAGEVLNATPPNARAGCHFP